MRHHSTSWSLLLLLLGCVAGYASDKSSAEEEKYLLRYEFKLGEVLRYEVEHTTNIRTTIEGTSQQAESKSDSIKAWKVTDVLPSGDLEFVHVVESVQMSNSVPHRELIEYDSTRDETPPPGFEQAARAIGVPLSIVRISPSGEVLQREEKHPQLENSDDLPITLRLAERPIAVGTQWDETYEILAERKSGAKLKVRTRRVCTLRQVSEDIATIDVEYQILTPVSAFVESQLVQRMTKGTVRFDIKQGRIISQEHDVDRRVLGFAGSASSMQYVSRFEERLLRPEEELARKP